MEDSDSYTESLRLEQGKDADEGRPEPGATAMSLGSMIGGPIGREGSDDASDSGSESNEADWADAERRDQKDA